MANARAIPALVPARIHAARGSWNPAQASRWRDLERRASSRGPARRPRRSTTRCQPARPALQRRIELGAASGAGVRSRSRWTAGKTRSSRIAATKTEPPTNKNVTTATLTASIGPSHLDLRHSPDDEKPNGLQGQPQDDHLGSVG